MNQSQRAIIHERRIKLAFFVAALGFLFVVLTKIDNLLVSFILALVSYYFLTPSVDFLERKGFSRTIATAIPFLTVVITIIVAGSILVPILVDQVSDLQASFPKYLETTNQFVSDIQNRVNDTVKNVYPLDIKNRLQPKFMEWGQAFFQSLPEYISKSLMVLFLAPLFAFFMLTDGRDFSRKLISLVPNNYFELVLNLNHQISQQIGGFIRARLLQSILVGLVIWVGLLILGFPYALVLAIFAGILNVIPYLGPLIGAVPAFLICFANGGDPSILLGLTLVYAAAQVLDTILITPFVVARIVNLHPVTVVLVIIAGSQLMGILGMIICIPVFSTLKVSATAIYRHLTDFRS